MTQLKLIITLLAQIFIPYLVLDMILRQTIQVDYQIMLTRKPQPFLIIKFLFFPINKYR